MSLKNPKTSRKCYKKSPASNVWAVLFKNAYFFWSYLKVTEWSKCKHFTYLKIFSVFIINGSTILFSKHGKIKTWKRWVM